MDLIFTVLIILLYAGVAFADNENFQLNVDSSQTETFASTSERVKHMAPDHYIPGNILFTDGTSLKTTDGSNTSVILYSTPTSEVSAEWFSGFIQLNDSQVILADYHKHCLRRVNRLTNDAFVYSGDCMNPGHVDGESAKFYNPNAVIRDVRNVSRLLVTDFGNSAIREVDTDNQEVRTFFMGSKTLYLPLGITQDSVTGDLFITTKTRIFMMIYDSRALLLITGTFATRFADGPFTRAEFSWPLDILLIQNRTQLLVADNDNHRVRLLDLITNTTSSICTGEPGDVEGDLHSCTLQYPKCLMILGDDLYIGEYRRIVRVSALSASPTTPSVKENSPNSTLPPNAAADSKMNSTQVIIISISVAAAVFIVMIIVGVICIYKFMIRAKRTATLVEDTAQKSEHSGDYNDYDDAYSTAADIESIYYTTIKDSPVKDSNRPPSYPSQLRTKPNRTSMHLDRKRKLPMPPVPSRNHDGMQKSITSNPDYIDFLPNEAEEQLNRTCDVNSIIYVEQPYYTRYINDTTLKRFPSSDGQIVI